MSWVRWDSEETRDLVLLGMARQADALAKIEDPTAPWICGMMQSLLESFGYAEWVGGQLVPTLIGLDHAEWLASVGGWSELQ